MAISEGPAYVGGIVFYKHWLKFLYASTKFNMVSNLKLPKSCIKIYSVCSGLYYFVLCSVYGTEKTEICFR